MDSPTQIVEEFTPVKGAGFTVTFDTAVVGQVAALPVTV